MIANYNYGRFLPDALDSLLSQSCQDFEIIIIDGGSTDNSVEVIKKYAGDLPPATERPQTLKPSHPHTLNPSTPSNPSNPSNSSNSSNISYWVSEPDKGQSDAFNKGFAKARGRFLTWLNADDVLLPGTIEKLKSAVGMHPECEWFVGGCYWLDKELRILKCFRARSFSEVRFRTGQVSSWGPSSFFTKRLLDKVGGVDVRCKYTMDGDLWLKFAAIAGARYLPFANYCWGLRLHECAKMSAHNFSESGQSDPSHPKWKQIAYEGAIRKEYFTPTAHRTCWNWFRSIRWGTVLMSRIDTVRLRGTLAFKTAATAK